MSRLNWLMIMMRIHASHFISRVLDRTGFGGNGEKRGKKNDTDIEKSS